MIEQAKAAIRKNAAMAELKLQVLIVIAEKVIERRII
jgi:hypothetical protein